jgi:rhodanese-related sulfurtransferase
MKIRMLTAFALALVASGIASAQPARPTVPQVCQSCHKPEAGEIRGIFENVAFKNKSIQLKIDSVTEIVRFDPKTIKLQDGEQDKPNDQLGSIAKNREARIAYTEKDGSKFATLISFKGPVRIAPERLVDFATVEKLVAQGPAKGGYTLIDSRPLPRFQEASIPTAINLPYPAFDKFLDRLPADKSKLVVFFCGGITCTMSPKSMQKVQAMGYTNAKVYREGMPEWSERRPGVTSPVFFKAAFVDKGIPHVLIDVREPAAVRAGYIPGAVGIPAADVKKAIAQLPDKKLAAPILVYDEASGESAKAAANAISAAGFPNVTYIAGGFAGWKAAGNTVYAGDIGTMIAYRPMPRPGEVSIDDFTGIAKATPPGTLILDVRNADEAKNGMIKGALLIPDEDLLARIGEIPKDKRIIAHCLTGTRAEMAYHKLKEKGFNAGFLRAAIAIDGTGAFKITPN